MSFPCTFILPDMVFITISSPSLLQNIRVTQRSVYSSELPWSSWEALNDIQLLCVPYAHTDTHDFTVLCYCCTTHKENLWDKNTLKFKKIIVKNVWSEPSTKKNSFQSNFCNQENYNLNEKALTESLAIYKIRQSIILFQCRNIQKKKQLHLLN